MTRNRVAILATVCGLTACGGAGAGLPSLGGGSATAPAAAAAPALTQVSGSAKVVVVPATLAFLEAGSGAARIVTVRERGNPNYVVGKGCAGIATVALSEKKKNEARYAVTPLSAGACSVRFSDGKRHGATLRLSVTTTSLALAASSVGPHAVLASVVAAGVTATSTLTGCAQGCAIAAPPSKPGNNAYAVTLYDAASGTAKVLARGTTTATIVAAKSNLVAAAPLRVAANATFGTLHAGVSGTSLSPAALSLAVKDADGDAIAGTFATPVVVTDDDVSTIVQGSYLTLNGGAAARSVTLVSSTNALAFGYGGLAIAPAHITASIASSVIAQTQFAPSLAQVGYTGPNNGWNDPEIDLYSAVSGQPGNAATFSLNQTGWNTTPFVRSFSFVPSGANNNCSSFTIVSTGASSYTVHPVASPQPGICTMMLTGATSSSSTALLLTYTIPNPVHVSSRHSPSRH